MASLPSHQPRQQFSSSTSQSSESSPTSNTQLPITNMESQPTLLNPESAAISTFTPTPETNEQPSPEVQECWICRGEDIDDPPGTIWKSPCPCSAVAHDACLLDWIADKEKPKAGEIARNLEIKCPVCQAPFNIERPRDYLVQVFDFVHKNVSDLAVPTALSGVAGCLYSGFLVYGLNTMQTVFGVEDARRVLGGIFQPDPIGMQWVRLIKMSIRWSLSAFDPFFPDYRLNSNWKIFLGLPLIGPSLILLRTKFADQAFALMLPIYFLDPAHRTPTWPPTPGLAFSTLPYIRSAYNELYRLTMTAHEKRWDQAVQRKPREGETAADVAAEAQQDNGDALFEIQVVQDVFEEEFDSDNEGDGVDVPMMNIDPVAPEVADAAAPVPPIEGGDAQINPQPLIIIPAAPAPPPNRNGGWEIRQDISTTHLINVTMGALFFPTVAACMGDILKLTLPATWVGSNVGLRYAGRYPSGLLKEKWGRTIVGGCLFVVLKDMVTLYCKWKKAKDFGKRNILNYVPKGRRA